MHASLGDDFRKPFTSARILGRSPRDGAVAEIDRFAITARAYFVAVRDAARRTTEANKYRRRRYARPYFHDIHALTTPSAVHPVTIVSLPVIKHARIRPISNELSSISHGRVPVHRRVGKYDEYPVGSSYRSSARGGVGGFKFLAASPTGRPPLSSVRAKVRPDTGQLVYGRRRCSRRVLRVSLARTCRYVT